MCDKGGLKLTRGRGRLLGTVEYKQCRLADAASKGWVQSENLRGQQVHPFLPPTPSSLIEPSCLLASSLFLFICTPLISIIVTNKRNNKILPFPEF